MDAQPRRPVVPQSFNDKLALLTSPCIQGRFFFSDFGHGWVTSWEKRTYGTSVLPSAAEWFSDFLVHAADRRHQPNAGKNGIQVKALRPRLSDSSVDVQPTYQNSHVRSMPTVWLGKRPSVHIRTVPDFLEKIASRSVEAEHFLTLFRVSER